MTKAPSPNSSNSLALTWAAFWATLIIDRPARWIAGTALLLPLPYCLPFDADVRSLLTRTVGPVLLLAMAVPAHAVSLGRIRRAEERPFWQDVAVFCGLQWAAAALPWRIATETVFALAGLFLMTAVERQPHRRNRWRSIRLERVLTWPSTAVFVASLLLYFVLIPLVVHRTEYDAALSSAAFYAALTVVIAAKLAYLTLSVRSFRWRALYGLLTLVVGTLFLPAVLRATPACSDPAHPLWSSRMSFLWLLPILILALVGRLRHAPMGFTTEGKTIGDLLEENLPGPAGQTMISALALPLFHFSCYAFGVLEDATKPAREFAVGWGVLALGAIAWIQYRFLEERARNLWLERDRMVRKMRSSEKDLRLMVERRHSQEMIEASRDRLRESFSDLEVPAGESFLDRVDAAAFVVDGDERVAWWNAAAERLYGWSADEIVGRPASSLCRRRAELGEACRRTAERGSWSGSLSQRQRDGQEVAMASRFVHIEGGDGEAAATLVLTATRQGRLERRE